MKYYKETENGHITGYSATEYSKSDCSGYVEITEEEYTAALAALQSESLKQMQSEKTKDKIISELEAENAALLFQILTGEELNNV